MIEKVETYWVAQFWVSKAEVWTTVRNRWWNTRRVAVSFVSDHRTEGQRWRVRMRRM